MSNPGEPVADPVAPIVETPAVPAVETPAAPAVVETPAPAVEAPPVVEAKAPEPVAEKSVEKPAEAKVEEVKPAPSLLAEAGKLEDKKPDGKPEDVKAVEAAPALPTYEAFTLPEGVSLEAKQLGDFTGMLAQFEADTKAPHELVQEFGQKAVDFYVNEEKRKAALQMETWNSTRRGWVDQIRQDPVLGRNRFDTVMRDAALVRDKFSTPRFIEAINFTGMGDHPGMMDFMHNLSKYLDKHGLLREGRPVAAPTARATPTKPGPRGRYAASQTN